MLQDGGRQAQEASMVDVELSALLSAGQTPELSTLTYDDAGSTTAGAAGGLSNNPLASGGGSSLLPGSFLKGVGLSVWQNSADTASQWSAFLSTRKFFGQNPASFVSGTNHFWDNYRVGLQAQRRVN